MKQNEPLRHPYKKIIKLAIDWKLKKNMKDLSEFIMTLEKQKISTVLRQNKNGQLYRITFIDHTQTNYFTPQLKKLKRKRKRLKQKP